MTCRAPTSSQTCPGSLSQSLSYDGARQLIAWTSTQLHETQSGSSAYNGEGQRVEQYYTVNVGNQAMTTYYIGNYEEVSIANGGATTTTK